MTDCFTFRSIIVRALLFITAALVSWAGIICLHLAEPDANDRSLRLHGVYDEVGHLLTALMIAIGLRALRFPIPIWSVLIGGVILDTGHVFDLVGITEPISGSSRNGSHSVFAIFVLACMGFIDRRHANVWLGISLGALSHLWRDMGTGSVALLWPASEQVDGTSYTRYAAGLLGVTFALIGSGTLLDTYAGAQSSDHAQQRNRSG